MVILLAKGDVSADGFDVGLANCTVFPETFEVLLQWLYLILFRR